MICALIAEYVLRLFFYAEPYWAPAWLWCIRLAATGYGLIRGKLWKDRGFWPLLAFQILILLRLVLDDASRIFEISVSESLLNAAWCMTGCYAAGRVLRRDQLVRFLRILLGLWTVGIVAHSLISVYAAWTGHVIWTIGEGGYWGLGGTIGGGDYHMLIYNATHNAGEIRLYTPVYSTVGGGLLGLSTVLIVCASIISRRKAIKALYALAALPVFLAMSLTDSRTGHIMTAVGLGMVIFASILWAFRKRDARRAEDGKRPAGSFPAWTAAITGMLVAIVFFVFAATKTIGVFNRIRSEYSHRSLLITEAMAEGEDSTAEAEADPLIVSNRGFSGSDVLTGRPRIWKNVLLYIQRYPLTLLTGTSLYYPMNGPNSQPEAPFMAGHCHCIPLQLTLACGLPGLFLILGFMIYVAVCAIRIVNSRGMPLWARLLPAPVVMIVAGECVECLTRLAYGWAVLPFMMIFCGMISALGNGKDFTDINAAH